MSEQDGAASLVRSDALLDTFAKQAEFGAMLLNIGRTRKSDNFTMTDMERAFVSGWKLHEHETKFRKASNANLHRTKMAGDNTGNSR